MDNGNERPRHLAGLVSAEAEALYERLLGHSGDLSGEDVDTESEAARELIDARLAFSPMEGHIQTVSRAASHQLLLAKRMRDAMDVYTSVAGAWSSLESLLEMTVTSSATVDGANDGPIQLITDPAVISRLSGELYVGTPHHLRATLTGRYENRITERVAVTPPPAALDSGPRFRTIYDTDFATSPAGRRSSEDRSPPAKRRGSVTSCRRRSFT